MKTTLLSTMLALATAGLLGQTTIFVKPNATGNGTSWSNATDLETAVTSATSGTQVWVQAATYHPKTMLTVPDGVALYGGFEGTELSLLQRDLTDKATVIDAQKKYGSVIRLGTSATLNGFTIQNGNAQHNPHRNGGGIWADDNATIENCLIINNTAMLNGGGLYSKGPTQIINTTIKDNTAKGSGDNMCGNCTTIISEGNSSGFSELTYNEITIHDTLVVHDTIIIRDTVTGLATTPIGELTDALVIDPHPATTAQTKELSSSNIFPTLVVGIAAGSSGPFYFQWYVSTTPDNTNGTPIAGADGSSYTPTSEIGSTFYYYCVVSNSEGSAVSNVSGAHRVTEKYCNFDVPGWGENLGTASFRNSNTYTVGGKTWSAEVVATRCDKTTYNGGAEGNYNADCKSYNRATYGDLFSWCALYRYGDQLCSGAWRIPTTEEIRDMILALGGTSVAVSTYYTSAAVTSKLVATSGTAGQFWGGVYGGSSNVSGTMVEEGSRARYWSQSEFSTTNGWYVVFGTNNIITPQQSYAKTNGLSLRCIRD